MSIDNCVQVELDLTDVLDGAVYEEHKPRLYNASAMYTFRLAKGYSLLLIVVGVAMYIKT